MRGLVWVAVLLAAVWGGWWLVGSRGVEAAAIGWFEAQTRDGRVARYDSLAVRGFPSRFDLTVTEPHLADPTSGFGWRAPFAQVFALSYKPWHLIAALPGGQVITTPEQEFTLQATQILGSLLLVPGTDLALSEAVVEGEALALSPALARVQGVRRAILSIRAEEGRANGYRLGLALSDVQMDAALAESAEQQDGMAQVKMDAVIALSQPLDRHAEQTRPALRLLDLREARILWGDLKLSGKGELTPDANGFAAGQIEVRVENWRLLPPLLSATGVISPNFAPTLERGLEVLAAQGDDPATLTLPLVAQNGRMSLGPLPLGPAPYWGE